MTRICGRGVCYIAAVALWVLLPPVDAVGEEDDGAAVAQLRGGPARTFAAGAPFAVRFLENTELNQRLSEIARRSLEDSGYRPVSKSFELLPVKSVAPKFVLNVSVAIERKLALRPVGLAAVVVIAVAPISRSIYARQEAATSAHRKVATRSRSSSSTTPSGAAGGARQPPTPPAIVMQLPAACWPASSSALASGSAAIDLHSE